MKIMTGEYKNSEVLLTAPLLIKAPRTIRILGNLIKMCGKMELDEEKNVVTVSYSFSAETPGIKKREYRITAVRTLDFSSGYSMWYVSAYADTDRIRGAHWEYNGPGRAHWEYDGPGSSSLEEMLDEAAKWISEKLTDYALENITVEDHNYDYNN